MFGKWLVPLTFVLAVLAARDGCAQSHPTTDQESRSILERLDQFGQNLFGGIFGDERPGGSQADSPREPVLDYQTVPQGQGEGQSRIGTYRPQPTAGSVRPQPARIPISSEPAAPRAGSILTTPPQYSPGSASPGPVPGMERMPSAHEGAAPGPYRREPPPGMSTLTTPAPQQRAGSPAQPVPADTAAGVPHPAQRPLHQRLSVMRDSAFSPTNPAPTQEHPESGRQVAAAEHASDATDPPATGRGGHLVIAQPTGEGVRQPAGAVPTGPTAAVRTTPEPTPARVAPRAAPAGTPAVRGEQGAGAGRSEGMLFTQNGPMLSVETFGPRTITIGRESSYRVSIRNSGEVAADEVAVYVQLPAWADVLGAEASTGATQLPAGGDGAFLWRVGQMQAQSSERLTLRLVPRESRPFDLAVRWEYQPLARQAMIEVQEPKLQMQLEGPREVHFGQRETYRLRLRNTGNGAAENVTISLLPVGAGSSQPVSHRLGLLEAGAEKLIEVELTARQTGNVTVRVEAAGDGNLRAELSEQILVRRAELELAAGGPGVRFVGSEVGYELRIANPGNATARNIQLSATMPSGAKYLSGIDGAHLEANGTRVSWTLPVLEPGTEQRYQVRASLGLPGTNRLEVVARADDALTASAEALTRVEAVADLALEVEDPRAPVPVGAEGVYRLRIRNRGTKAAEHVEVIGYFSRGIEPVSAEGATHRIGPGQVVFSPIASLAAGSEVVLTIRARAEQPGNHVFRAEMHCKPLDTRLVREETTHFYQDDSNVAAGPEAGDLSTADRRAAAGETAPSAAPARPSDPRR